MNWKKIIKYFVILTLTGSAIFIFLANRDMNKIYGGHTQKASLEHTRFSDFHTIIKDINILSTDGETFLPNQTVRIEEGVIVAIDSVYESPDGAQIIDGKGKYLIPGLTDAHVHLFKSPNDLLLYLANGITQIRELIGEEDHLLWREEIKTGRLGPDMYIASPRLGSFGTFEGFFMEWSQGFQNIKNREDAAKYVTRFKEKGYDAVKLYSHLNRESYLAICQIADSLGMDAVGHIPWSVEWTDIMASHQSDISHLEEIMNALRREFGRIEGEEGAAKFLAYVDNRSKEMAEDLLANNMSVTTTLWLTESFVRQKFDLNKVLKEVELEYVNPGISEWSENIPQGGLGWLPEVNRYQLNGDLSEEELDGQKIFWTAYAEACQIILKNLSDSGVIIMAGTDANLPVAVPGFSLHDELQSLYQAGMTTAEVLRSATSAPAERLKIKAGKIKEGYKANLVILNKNPLEDIRHTKTIDQVILHGKVLDRKVLDELLSSVKNANDLSRKVDIATYSKAFQE